MQRAFWMIVLAALLAGCAGPQAANSPTPTNDLQPTTQALTPTPAPTAAATALAPTAEIPTQAGVPTARPTDAPATAVPATPAAPATQPPAATAAGNPTQVAAPAATATQPPAAAADGPALPDAPLDPRAQSKALLPEFAGDLDRAGEWNRYTISATIDPQARTIAGRERIEY